MFFGFRNPSVIGGSVAAMWRSFSNNSDAVDLSNQESDCPHTACVSGSTEFRCAAGLSILSGMENSGTHKPAATCLPSTDRSRNHEIENQATEPFRGSREVPQGRQPRKARQVAAPAREAIAGQGSQASPGVLAQAHFHRVRFCHDFGPIRVWRFGSAPRLGRGGRWFEPSHPDHQNFLEA